MRAGTHEVKLAGGSLVLPLTMDAYRILGRIPANPLDLSAGPVDPGAVCRGEQNLRAMTLVDCLAALAKVPVAEVFATAAHKDLAPQFWEYCLELAKAMGPEKVEGKPDPKS